MKRKLLKPYDMGNGLILKNKIVMAPMTRSRSEDTIPNNLMADYYRQRSSAGLIITEGSQINPVQARGYINTPGIHSDEQVDGWKMVTDAVHISGGKIFIQLWHVGAISHPLFQNGEKPVSASPFNPGLKIYTDQGLRNTVECRAMTTSAIKSTIDDYEKAAENAVKAGFDGVEIDAANGYLLHQFVSSHTNRRKDLYGGSIERRCTIIFEVIDRVSRHMAKNRIGIKLNPSIHGILGSKITDDTIPTYDYLINKLNDEDLAYIHLSEPLTDVSKIVHALKEVTGHYRKIYSGTIITESSYTSEIGNQIIDKELADLVAYGIPFIANPDLVKKIETGTKLIPAEKKKYYKGGTKGYIDYPSMTKFEDE